MRHRWATLLTILTAALIIVLSLVFAWTVQG
jgi:hypothetical protein